MRVLVLPQQCVVYGTLSHQNKEASFSSFFPQVTVELLLPFQINFQLWSLVQTFYTDCFQLDACLLQTKQQSSYQIISGFAGLR